MSVGNLVVVGSLVCSLALGLSPDRSCKLQESKAIGGLRGTHAMADRLADPSSLLPKLLQVTVKELDFRLEVQRRTRGGGEAVCVFASVICQLHTQHGGKGKTQRFGGWCCFEVLGAMCP